MKVIIPVAGVGTRLKPHTNSLPKPLLHVGGKTILDYLLQPLEKVNPEEVVFVIGYMGEMIREHVRKNYSFKATFVEQDRLLGLGYAIHTAMEAVGEAPLLIILGDTIVECDLKGFINAGEYALGLRQVDDPTRFGIAEISNGFVVGVEEKPAEPKTDLALIGLYYFRESGRLHAELDKLIASGKRTSGEIQLTDALAAMIKAGTRFVPFEVQQWYDCGKKETMLQTNRHILQRMPPGQKIPGSVIIDPVYIAEDVKIILSVIGPNVSIARGTVIEGSHVSDSIIGENANLKDTAIKHSILGSNTVVKGASGILNIGDSSEISGS